MKRLTAEMIRITIFVAYIVGILALFGTFLRPQNGIQMLESVEPIFLTGTISVDKGPVHDIKATEWRDQNVRSVTVNGFFNHEINNGDSLIIWPRNLRVKIYVNGNLKVSTGQREEFPDFIQYAGNSYKIFYIGEVSVNDEIRMEIEKAYGTCRINVIDNFFANLYVGKEGAVYHSIVSHELLHLLIGLALISVGTLVLFASFLQRFSEFPHMRRIYYLGWFCFVGGISYACDSSYEFMDLIFPYPVFNTLVDLCCIPLLLIFFLLYVTSVIKSRTVKRFMRGVTIFFILLGMIPVLLQIFGIQDMHVIQDQYVFMGGIIVFLGFGAVVFEMLWFKNTEMKKVLIAILPFVVSLSFKIVNVIREKGVERSYIRIGILASCLLLLHNTLRYVRRSMHVIEQEQQMKEDLKNAQVAIMLSQIQPHFLYNALNTLQHICRKDGALAAEAIDHFSRYLRGNMNSLTADKPIPFEEELDHIEHYLYIEHLRFGDRVHVKYDLEVTNFNIPTLTLQPIVENAIRHGITKQAEGGVVTISTRQMQDEIWIIVADNGIGFETEEYGKDGRRHIGLENVRKRLKLQSNGTLMIISKKGVGTEVTIRLKEKGSRIDESNGRG